MAMPTSGNNKQGSMSDKDMGCAWCGGVGAHHFGKKIFMTIVGVLLVYAVVFLGTLIRNNVKKYNSIGKADKMERTVVVNGFGKVSGSNDIAMTTIGYSNTDKDVAKAQADNKKVMDPIYEELKKLGVADKDLQSNYTVYPDYNYTQDRGQELKGYRVSNSLTVKIRDLNKITDILNLAGKYGATEVSGLSFTIDDPESLKAQARDKALADLRVKAENLAKSLGVQFGGIVNYNEYEGGGDYYPPVAYATKDMGGGMGGGGPVAVPGGSKDVTMNVSVVFEILQ